MPQVELEAVGPLVFPAVRERLDQRVRRERAEVWVELDRLDLPEAVECRVLRAALEEVE